MAKQQELDFEGRKMRYDQIELLNKDNVMVGGPWNAKQVNCVRRLVKKLFALTDDAGECHASQEYLAKVLDCSRRTIISWCIWAENMGVLGTLKVESHRGHRHNCYQIQWDAIAEFVELTPQKPCEVSSPGHVKSRHNPCEVSSPGHVKSRHIDLPLINKLSTASTKKDDPEWAAAAESLRGCKLAMVRQALKLARQHGLTPADVVFACETYRANAARLDGPGALWTFLREGEWPADGVEDPDVIRARNEAHEARKAHEHKALGSLTAAVVDRRQEIQQLRANYGAQLQSMSEEEFDDLVLQTYGENPIQMERYRQGKIDEEIIRIDLLNSLKAREEKT